MTRNHKILSIFITLSAILAGCETATTPQTTPITVAQSDRTLFIVNEGAFMHQNSSMDAMLFRVDSSKHDTTYDSKVLSKMGLGNDIQVDGNRALILDNGTNSLDIVNADSLHEIASIPFNLDAPNKMALISPDTLVVTRRNTTSAAIVDLNSARIVDSIPLGEVSIAVCVLQNKAFITTGASEYNGPYHLAIYDFASHKIIKTISLPESPEQALADSSSGNVIIGMSGDGSTTSSELYFLNATNDAIVDSLTPGTPSDDPELTTGSKHFIVMGTKVYALAGPTHTLPVAFINGTVAYYKGMFDATSNALYLGNPGDYTNPGTVDAYDASTGKLLWSRPTGIIPGHFAFYH